MSEAAPVVLLVEGDIVARSPLAEYLRECGFTVIEAASGEEAQIALRTPDLKIEAVLVDMQTPGGGFALSGWIRAQAPHVQVILAGSVDAALERAGALCNEGPALAKPYAHHLVRDEIRRAIAQRARALGCDGDKPE